MMESSPTQGRLVDLSHVLAAGEPTYRWLPAPEFTDYLSRDSSRATYAPGTTFLIQRMSFIGNSSTYLDAPYHRHEDGDDLAALPLDQLANVPGRVADVTALGDRQLTKAVLEGNAHPLRGHAVLWRTGWDRWWGSEHYWAEAPFLSGALAEFLVAAGVALVGIDALNVDDPDDLARPAHTILLGAGIPIVENLRGLDRLPEAGFRFFAAPPRVAEGSAFPVRAFALVP